MAEKASINTGIADARIIISTDTGMPVQKGMTNKEGACAFELAPGSYIVSAFADGYYGGKANVELNAGGPTKVVELVLAPNDPPPAYGMLSLYVTDGMFKDKGIGGASVKVFDSNGDLRGNGLTDDIGYFKPVLTVGAYKVIVSAFGFDPATVTVNVNETTPTYATVVLPAQPRQNLNLWVISNGTNEGVPGAEVLVLDANSTPRAQGATDNFGNFSPLLPPGTYKVIASAPEYYSTSLVVELPAVPRGEIHVTVVLYPIIYRPLNVYVEAAGRDSGLVGATVKVLNMDHTIQAQGLTDERGYFRPSMPVGFYKVTVTAPNYQGQTISVVVTEEDPSTDIAVVLQRIDNELGWQR
jgi:hypothetical protein